MNKKIEEIIEHFNDKELIKRAFTHKSWVNENTSNGKTNERLEFLGDAILEYVVSSFIFDQFRDKEEGFLTALRSNIVNTKNLAKLAKEIHVGDQLLLSKGEEHGGGRSNPALLADTVEAIIGAIYKDKGLDAASDFIHQYLLSDIDSMLELPLKDPKSRLQEFVQSKGKMAPRYKVVHQVGPDHNKTFRVQVSVEKDILGEGEGSSKLKAEQASAEHALAKLGAKA